MPAKNPTLKVARDFVKRGAKAQAAVNAILAKPHHGTAAPAAAAATRLTPDELRRVGEALYGRRFQAELAEALDVDFRLVKRWVVGERPVSERARPLLRELVARRRQKLAELDGWL